MATIEDFRKIVMPRVETIFKKFFSDKYDENVLKLIFHDLSEMIREKYIEEISFCYYDSGLEKIVSGIVLKFNYKSSNNKFILEEKIDNKFNQLSETSEKFLIIKLLKSDGAKRNKVLNEIKNYSCNWSFIEKVEYKVNASTEIINLKNLTVEYMEIKNG